MKANNIFIVIVILLSVKSKAQNPAFYKTDPNMSNLQWYYQLNVTPVIIENGLIVSENNPPNWYNGFQFDNCPGIFNSVNEAYSYLSNRQSFLSDYNAYYNRTDSNQQAIYIDKKILDRAKAYTTDSDAINDINSLGLATCKESIVFGELYLKINNEEFLIIDYLPMYFFNLDYNSSVDINLVLDCIKGNNDNEIISNGLMSTILFKENGTWKYIDGEKADDYIDGLLNSNITFTNSNGGNFVDVESSVNSSGTRVYYQK